MQASKKNGKPSRLEALCQQKNTVLMNIERIRRSIKEKLFLLIRLNWNVAWIY